MTPYVLIMITSVYGGSIAVPIQGHFSSLEKCEKSLEMLKEKSSYISLHDKQKYSRVVGYCIEAPDWK